MSYRTVHLLLNVDEEPRADAAIDYAVEFARREVAHLCVTEATQTLDLSLVQALPLAEAIVAQVNDERRARAENIGAHIEVAARLAGVTMERAIVALSPSVTRQDIAERTRLCDLVIAARPQGVLLTGQKLIEEVLFSSGRPVLVIPPDWSGGLALDHVVIAWDGGAKAARAVGDALPLLEKAGDIEAICVTGDPEDTRAADLARHLSRHCPRVSATNLPYIGADAGRTILRHARSSPVNLVVMGAYAHSRLVELVVGGATALMLNEARVPVLYSF
ncbi:MAG TPA: universal stress protein [Rhodoblastus sp.]|nr:universal stress protein [Rhodoblastus sp.]